MLLFFPFLSVYNRLKKLRIKKIKCPLRSLSATTKQKPALLTQAPAVGAAVVTSEPGAGSGVVPWKGPIPRCSKTRLSLQVPAGQAVERASLRKCLGSVERAANLCQSHINQRRNRGGRDFSFLKLMNKRISHSLCMGFPSVMNSSGTSMKFRYL